MNKIRDLEKGRCSEKKKWHSSIIQQLGPSFSSTLILRRYSIFVFHARRIPYVYLHIRPYVGSRFSNLNNWRKESNISLLFFRYPSDKRQSQNIFLFFFPQKRCASLRNKFVRDSDVRETVALETPNPT